MNCLGDSNQRNGAHLTQKPPSCANVLLAEAIFLPPAREEPTMYVDNLDGRITAAFYDEKAAAWRLEQAKLQRRIIELRKSSQNFEHAVQATEETCTVCTTFASQPVAEQRRLLKLLVEKATWRGGELETTLRTPFQKLRLSNHTTATKQGKNGHHGREMENWLPGMDSNH